MSDEIDDEATSQTSCHMTAIARVSGRRFWAVDQKLLMLRVTCPPTWTCNVLVPVT
jgi:hypothetical protein